MKHYTHLMGHVRSLVSRRIYAFVINPAINYVIFRFIGESRNLLMKLGSSFRENDSIEL